MVLTENNIALITDGLMDILDDVRYPGQSWSDLFDDDEIEHVGDARNRIYNDVIKSAENGNFDWAIDMCRQYEDIDEDSPWDSWFAMKCGVLAHYIEYVQSVL